MTTTIFPHSKANPDTVAHFKQQLGELLRVGTHGVGGIPGQPVVMEFGLFGADNSTIAWPGGTRANVAGSAGSNWTGRAAKFESNRKLIPYSRQFIPSVSIDHGIHPGSKGSIERMIGSGVLSFHSHGGSGSKAALQNYFVNGGYSLVTTFQGDL